ncbi:gluconokinase [Pseudomaricurvus alkylphenolicus]|uniref:gluconokinase n=1 Tax=Pseudomaricurvus alkylphenolicus TaxID=1306991 RepID=UPI00141ECE81|nr:gluconokinase [Pseudomaricurvus alkylphenolicus]NIB40594.1 gluconokinase [Pseudomaricurvus alkylphenolicus]
MINRPLIVMGVSSCGKSTLARAFSSRFELPFVEGDEFHPPANVNKMQRGIALDDEDRKEWLQALCLQCNRFLNAKESVVLSCSALKKRYRDQFRRRLIAPPQFLYLDIIETRAHQRCQNRQDHFMPKSLIRSQFETLECPVGEADVIRIDAEWALEDQIAFCEYKLNLVEEKERS